ncbi:MAG: hypothetical protein U0736_04955 [Gemmataceae bacterium]
MIDTTTEEDTTVDGNDYFDGTDALPPAPATYGLNDYALVNDRHDVRHPETGQYAPYQMGDPWAGTGHDYSDQRVPHQRPTGRRGDDLPPGTRSTVGDPTPSTDDVHGTPPPDPLEQYLGRGLSSGDIDAENRRRMQMGTDYDDDLLPLPSTVARPLTDRQRRTATAPAPTATASHATARTPTTTRTTTAAATGGHTTAATPNRMTCCWRPPWTT